MQHKREKTPQRVLRQLLESLLFECITEYDYFKNVFYFTIGGLQIKAKGKIGAFGRIHLDSEHIFYFEAGVWQIPDISMIINNLKLKPEVASQLSEEIKQTIKLSEWNENNLLRPVSRRNLSYRELESAIDEGHPYHPCFKARTGFNIKDHVDYGPEFANTFKLHWLAIRKEFIKNQFSFDTPENNQQDVHQHRQFWLAELGAETWGLLGKRLLDAGGNWEQYRLLPAHPWQIKQLQNQLQSQLQNGNIIDLKESGDDYQASISVRTLINVTHPKKANIKLPLSMVNSSSMRTIESHSITSAPFLSQWLSKVLQEDKLLHQESILREYAGIRLHSSQAEKSSPTWLNQLDGRLGVIFRESVEKYHEADKALPFVALSVVENDHLPFIDPWIKRYGVEAWLQQLVKTTVIPIWHLLVHHGIAVEAHAQNIILIHNEGWAHRLVLRDFHESLEFVYDYLKQAAMAPDFPALHPCYSKAKPDKFYWMSSTEALRELLVDTLFVFNLSELSTLLENYYSYDENRFWQLVYLEFQKYAQAGYTDARRVAALDIYENSIQTESLLKKKLQGKSTEEFHHQTSNALAREFLEKLSSPNNHVNQEELDNLLC